MLAVAASARAFTADPRIEVTLSPGFGRLRCRGRPLGWQTDGGTSGNVGRPSWPNALQVEKMLRITAELPKMVGTIPTSIVYDDVTQCFGHESLSGAVLPLHVPCRRPEIGFVFLPDPAFVRPKFQYAND